MAVSAEAGAAMAEAEVVTNLRILFKNSRKGVFDLTQNKNNCNLHIVTLYPRWLGGKVLKTSEITTVELIAIANAVLISCFRRIEDGHWVPAHMSYHPELHCTHCSYKECANGCFQFLDSKHSDNCVVLRAQKIIDESLPSVIKTSKIREA